MSPHTPDVHKNTINKRSKKSSILTNLPFADVSFASANNYVNKDNIHPSPGDLIHVNDIVFSKEDLVDNKWLIVPSPNEEFKVKVVKILNGWRCSSTWIVVQSEEFLRDDKERRERVVKETDDIYRHNNDHATLNCLDPSTIDLGFIRAKYQSLEKFQKSHPEYIGELTSRFQTGDEIWHYDETLSELTFGTFNTFFLLIRNNKIIYSPWIGGIMRDD